MPRRLASFAVAAASAAAMLAGCTVYRFSSPDHPSRISAETVAAASRRDDVGTGSRFTVAKVRGFVFRSGVGRLALSPETLNESLSSYWPSLFAESGAGGGIPLTVEIGGDLSADGGFAPGSFGVDIALMLVGLVRMEYDVEVSARILVDNAVWSEKASAKGTCDAAMWALPLPLPYLMPPYESDWPVEGNIGVMATDAGKTERIANDLASVAILKAVAALTPQQIADIKNKALLDKKQMGEKARLGEGTRTFAAVGSSGNAVSFAETSHEFKPDETPAARDIPEILEQRYDERTRRGIVRADMSGCAGDRAYRYLTERLIPAICETKNVVLDPDAPPPAHAKFKTLGERKEDGSHVLSIEFEAVE